MTPVAFPQANTRFGPPESLEESQCKAVPAFRAVVQGGSADGANLVVVAWLPAPAEVLRILHGPAVCRRTSFPQLSKKQSNHRKNMGTQNKMQD